MQGARKVNPVQIRMPEDLRIWLQHKAVDNFRSLNGELVARLLKDREREEKLNAERQ